MLDSRKKGKACVSSNVERGLIAWKNGKNERFAARYALFPVRFFADGGSSTILFRGGMEQGQRIANSMLAFPRWIVIYARRIPPRKKQSSSRDAISRPLAPRSQSIRFVGGFVSTGFCFEQSWLSLYALTDNRRRIFRRCSTHIARSTNGPQNYSYNLFLLEDFSSMEYFFFKHFFMLRKILRFDRPSVMFMLFYRFHVCMFMYRFTLFYRFHVCIMYKKLKVERYL